jgi:hypothetical protein
LKCHHRPGQFIANSLLYWGFDNTDHSKDIETGQPVDHPAEIPDQALSQGDFPAANCPYSYLYYIFTGRITGKPFQDNKISKDDDQENTADRVENDPEMIFRRHEPGAFDKVGDWKEEKAENDVIEDLGEDAEFEAGVIHCWGFSFNLK